MIEYFEVDGFKSLRNFSLHLDPGLNVLIGPNGSGKTNIITFLEFLGLLQSNSVSKAVSAIGGAGSVFSKIGEDKYVTEMSAIIKGNFNMGKRGRIGYKYSFTISLSDTFDTIIYKKQRIQYELFTEQTEHNFKTNNVFLDIEQSPNKNRKTSTIVKTVNLEIVKTFRLRWLLNECNSDSKFKANFKRFFKSDVEVIESLLKKIVFLIPLANLVLSDFQGGLVYNIEPSRCRIPEDAAKQPGIHKNGSGLYATLYSLTQNTQRNIKNIPFLLTDPMETSFFRSNVSLNKIKELVSLANYSIKDIEVINNPFDNQLQVRVHIDNNTSKNIVLPLAAMSDGTIKWLCLITILFTSEKVLSIEEPENYLHPLMLKEILSIMRDVIQKESIIILSTHSETLVNNTEPNEVIIVQYKDGMTKATRPNNIEMITNEINSTGFGLGYYYLSGALSDE